MPAMRNFVLERRFRRADLPTLQGAERLADRRARQPGLISSPVTLVDQRPISLEPYWTQLWPVSTSFTQRPTDTVTRFLWSPTG